MGCDDSHHRSQSPELLQLVSSSSSSSESSFREIEDAFLQTQTRIWLGEVLQIRLDEQLTISDVLADGELLFQVSKVVWILLLAKHVELRHIIAYQHQPFAPKENIGKYRPYSNVDSFLKVPDFDIVSYTITMPKDMVGCIRRNLELSQSSLAASPPYYLQKHAGGRYRQSYSVTASPRDQETYLEESDDTEINHPELQSDGLCTDFLCDYTSQINSSVEDTQVPPMVKSAFMSRDLDQLVIESQQRIDTSENEFELLCSMESLHPCSENIEHNCNFTWSSSPSCGNSHLDTGIRHAQESGIMDFNYSKQNWFGRRDALERVGTSNLISHAKAGGDPEENSTSNIHHSASSHGSNTTPGSFEYGRRYFEIGDNMEVLTNWSMESLNLGDKFDAQDNFENPESFELHTDKMELWNQRVEGYKSQDTMKYREMADETISNARYSHYVEKFEENQKSLYSNAGFHESEDLLSFQSYLSPEFCKWDQKGKCALISAKDHKSFASSFPKVGSYEEKTPCVRHKASEVMSSVPNEEEAAVNLDIDGKKLNKDCQAVLSYVVGVDYHGKCPSNEDAANDQDIGDRSERVLHMVTDDVPSSYQNGVVPCKGDEGVYHTRSCLTNECSKLECKDGDQACQYDMDPACHSEYTIEEHLPEEIKPEDEEVLPSADNSVEKRVVSIERPRGKPQNMLLLKSVLGGTAAFGVLVMFLHLRRNGREKGPASIKASSDTVKDKVQEYSSQNTKRRSRTEGVYPAEKLKLGD